MPTPGNRMPRFFGFFLSHAETPQEASPQRLWTAKNVFPTQSFSDPGRIFDGTFRAQLTRGMGKKSLFSLQMIKRCSFVIGFLSLPICPWVEDPVLASILEGGFSGC